SVKFPENSFPPQPPPLPCSPARGTRENKAAPDAEKSTLQMTLFAPPHFFRSCSPPSSLIARPLHRQNPHCQPAAPRRHSAASVRLRAPASALAAGTPNTLRASVPDPAPQAE